MARLLKAHKIFTGEEWLSGQCVTVENGRVAAIDKAADNKGEHLGEMLVPAFIDVQLYGGNGKLLAVHPEPATLLSTYEYCLSGGAVLCLPTVATNTLETFYRCIDAVRDYWAEGGKGVFGLHLEGPWLNPDKKGAHVPELIHPPAMDEVKSLLKYGSGVIKMITVAPEVCDADILRYIKSEGVILSAGHSNATYQQAISAFGSGVDAVTHLFNAMSGLHHREPGLVGASFAHDRVAVSVIPDGHHVDYSAIRIAKRSIGERLFAITDAVTETSEGYYQHKMAGDKYECNGVLSGSALTMHKCFYNLVSHAEIEIGEALRMCSLYPARLLRQDHLYGKIAPGYAAQFVVLNKQLEMSSVVTL